jgi:hypothetical protein
MTTALSFALSQSRSGPGSNSAPPLPADPNFGLVTRPVVVRAGLGAPLGVAFLSAAGV